MKHQKYINNISTLISLILAMAILTCVATLQHAVEYAVQSKISTSFSYLKLFVAINILHLMCINTYAFYSRKTINIGTTVSQSTARRKSLLFWR